LNPSSDSIVSGVQAQSVDCATCMFMCYTTCGGPHNPECPPWDVEQWCFEQCTVYYQCT
jgi:hypothetical protein